MRRRLRIALAAVSLLTVISSVIIVAACNQRGPVFQPERSGSVDYDEAVQPDESKEARRDRQLVAGDGDDMMEDAAVSAARSSSIEAVKLLKESMTTVASEITESDSLSEATKFKDSGLARALERADAAAHTARLTTNENNKASGFSGHGNKPSGEASPVATGIDLRDRVARQSERANAKLTFTSVGPADEIWVIGRPAQADAPRSDDYPGSGAMLALLPVAPGPEVDRRVIEGEPRPIAEMTRVPMPLKHTAVRAQVTGYISTVDVTQQFLNPFEQKIEAVYVFPLPQDAAVSEFVMTIGERKIRGIIREREEAKQIYEQAKAQGYNAALLTQERPNIFTQKVANIEPGKQIDVNIRYFNTLRYEDGWYSFVFPTVVGPRFNPAGTADPINAVSRGEQATGAGTDVQYLRPDERSGHDISIEVAIDAGVTVEQVSSLNHVVRHQGVGTSNVAVQLSEADRVPNKDFVVKFRVAGETVKSNLMTWRGEDGVGYFTLMLYPPKDLSSLKRQAMEMVFVLDCSGSMSGRPIEQSKAAMLRALMHMQADDTFQVIRFSEKATALGAAPLPVTDKTRDRAADYVRKLQGSGGTQMIEGIKAALDFPHDPQRYRVVTFLTDGYIGNENQIIGEVNNRVGNARIFSFGVGSSPNRFLLERMAKLGRGTAGFLGLNDSGAEVMDLYFERISHPAMTDIDIDWGTMQVSDVYPQKLPDLFVGRPVIITGKFTGVATTIKVNGKTGSQAIAMDLTPDVSDEHKAVAKVWARMRIADLADQQTWDRNNADELGQAIFGTAMEHGLMSAYTAFVAVDASQTTAGGKSTTVPVAVPVPDGVKYETTVADR